MIVDSAWPCLLEQLYLSMHRLKRRDVPFLLYDFCTGPCVHWLRTGLFFMS